MITIKACSSVVLGSLMNMKLSLLLSGLKTKAEVMPIIFNPKKRVERPILQSTIGRQARISRIQISLNSHAEISLTRSRYQENTLKNLATWPVFYDHKY